MGSYISNIVEKFRASFQATPLLTVKALLGKLNHTGRYCQ